MGITWQIWLRDDTPIDAKRKGVGEALFQTLCLSRGSNKFKTNDSYAYISDNGGIELDMHSF